MAYDITLVQISGPTGASVGSTVFPAVPNVGFPTTFNFLLISWWMCLPSGFAPGPNILAGSNCFTNKVQGDGTVRVHLETGTGTPLYDALFAATPHNRQNVMVSVDCTSQIVQVYCNDAELFPTSGDGWIASSNFQDVGFVSVDTGSFGNWPAGADLWIAATPSFVDLSNPANRRKFINADLTPVFLAGDGSAPFGYSPQVFLTVPSGGVPDDFAHNYGTGGVFHKSTFGGGAVLTFQTPGACTLPTPTTSEWVITSNLQTPAQGAVGDIWFDNSYVNFDDETTRNGFQNSDGTWKYLGQNGELPTGSSPLDFLTVPAGGVPSDILFGYGQNGGQDSWFLISNGLDPIATAPYPDMSFDDCVSPVGNLELTDMQVQMFAPMTTDNTITLCWSDDAGASWSNGILKSLGAPGEYFTTPSWYRLGLSRNRVYELSWSSARAEALQGCWVEVTIAET